MFSKEPKVTFANNALVVSFPGKEPRVWRIDMGQFISSALEIRDDHGQFTLIFKSGSAVEEIGAFADRKKALAAMQSITAALMQGQNTARTAGPIKKFFKFLLMAIVVGLVAIFIIANLSRQPVNVGDTMNAPTGLMPEAPAESSTAPAPAGIPVPADQVIGGEP